MSSLPEMIVVVAPYSPLGRGGYSHLGGSRKLEAIISILAEINPQIILVNSAHNEFEPAPLKSKLSDIAGFQVFEITPSISASPTLGKLKNIYCVDNILKAILERGRPQLFWFYNGYAFEMHMAKKAHQKLGLPMILEFEDWHFSRSRGVNPKPYLDYFFWRRAAKCMSGVFAVNNTLASKMLPFTTHVNLLPGIVPKVLAEIANVSLPFSTNSDVINVGYFGGLTVEKGADILLQLVIMLPDSYVLHVTGTGQLAAEFEACAKKYPDRLHYHGLVNDETLYELISKCDVMLNPHSSIENMDDGIFPFKIIEAVASGRLLISTAVPQLGLEDVLKGVLFVGCSANFFLEAILASREHYFQNSLFVKSGAYIANQRFGVNAILDKVKLILKSSKCIS